MQAFANKNVLLPICLLVLFSVGSGCKKLYRLQAKGGAEFKVQIETTEKDNEAILRQAIKITQNKLDVIDVDGETRVDPDNSNQFIVRIYGSPDMERMKTFLFTTYQLELRKVVSPPNPSPVKTFLSEDEANKVSTAEDEVFLYSIYEGAAKQYVILENSVIVNGEGIRDAQAISASGSSFGYTIAFSLNPQAAATFGDWTGKNIGNYMAVVLDKKIQSIAYIKSQIFDSGEISGRFTKLEAEDIALSLKSGFFPGTMKIVSETKFDD